jgi:hypothetical protein
MLESWEAATRDGTLRRPELTWLQGCLLVITFWMCGGKLMEVKMEVVVNSSMTATTARISKRRSLYRARRMQTMMEFAMLTTIVLIRARATMMMLGTGRV